MDIFIEQIVSKKPSAKDTAGKIGIGTLSVLVSIALFLLLGTIGILLAVACIYLGFYLSSNFDVEYEYIITNGEIDIDKIIAKRKRKRLVTVKASAFERFGLLKEAPPADESTKIVASGFVSESDYYADFRHSKFGQVRLIFSPDEKSLEAIKPFIPRNIRQTN